jgi:hypothetical protein
VVPWDRICAALEMSAGEPVVIHVVVTPALQAARFPPMSNEKPPSHRIAARHRQPGMGIAKSLMSNDL